MAYSVDNIITVNIFLTAAGLGYGDFSSALTFADHDDLVDGLSGFLPDTYRDYSTLPELAEDFKTDSDIYKIATRFFTQIPKPPVITVWMRKQDDADILVTVNKADDLIWRYHYFLKTADVTQENLIKLGDWADSTGHPFWVTVSSPDVMDNTKTDDIASVMAAKGNRHIFLGFKLASSVVTDSSQAYAMVQLAAAFNKFRPRGTNTAITGEYQVLTGVSGDNLKTSQYSALKAKKAVFFTQIELAGQVDTSRVINSKSMSSYGEFIDDVVNLDVLKNYLQVDGYNYITSAPAKRALTRRDYAGLLSVLAATCKRFYDNGVLGEGTYTDPDTGKEMMADFGFVVRSLPEDVLKLTKAQRRAREYPPTSILVILARAGHTAEINLTVE